MPSSSPAGALQMRATGRSYVLYAGLLLIVAGLVALGWTKLSSDWTAAPAMLLGPVMYLLLMLIAPQILARSADPVRLDHRWELWLRTVGCMALLLLAGLGFTMRGSVREVLAGIALGIGSAYAAATAVIISRRNFGPLAHAYSGPVMRETASGVPGWFRPVYWLGAPARLLARKLFPGVSLGLGSVLTLSSLLLMTSGSFGCKENYYRGYQLFELRYRWISAENLASGMAQKIQGVTGVVFYAMGLLAALLAIALLARGGAVLARATLALATAAVLFLLADGFAIAYSENDSPALPIVTLGLLAIAAALLIAAQNSKSPPERDVATLRVAALFVPPLIFSYGVLILIATLRVWGYVAYFFGVQLVWWGALQTKRSLER